LPALIHFTVLHGSTLPCTLSVSAELPAAAEVCDSDVIVGTESGEPGVDNVNDDALDVPTELTTVTTAVPGNAASAAEIEAVN